MFNKRIPREKTDLYRCVNWEKSPPISITTKVPRKISENSSAGAKTSYSFRRYSDGKFVRIKFKFQNNKGQEKIEGKKGGLTSHATPVRGDFLNKETDKTFHLESHNGERRSSDRPPLKINYSNYSNTFFFPKSVTNSNPIMNKLKTNSLLNESKLSQDEEKATQPNTISDGISDKSSNNSSRYNSFHNCKSPKDVYDSVTNFLGTEKDPLSPSVNSYCYRKSSSGNIPSVNKRDSHTYSENNTQRNFLSESNLSNYNHNYNSNFGISANNQNYQTNFNLFPSNLNVNGINFTRPQFNYASHNTNSTATSNYEECHESKLVNNVNSVNMKNYQRQKSLYVASNTIDRGEESRRKSYTSGESESLRKSFPFKNGSHSNQKPYNKFNTVPINKENTEILSVKLNHKGQKELHINRFDDVFSSTTTFCNKNNISETLIKSVIITICQSLDLIYKIYNSSVNERNADYLKSLQQIWEGCKETTPIADFEIENKISQLNDCREMNEITSISSISISREDHESQDDFLNNFSVFNKSF